MDKQIQLRHEFKFEIDKLEYQVLQRKLDAALQPDPNMHPNLSYTVRSLYFDNYENSALTEKEAGIFLRKKYRLRLYNHNDNYIKFEKKTKNGQYILKEVIRVSRDQADRMIGKDYSFLAETDNGLLRAFYLETRCKLIRPVSIVEYEREAYVYPVGKVRVTFDTGLRTSLDCIDLFNKNACMLTAQAQKGIILEVKYNEILPKFIIGLFPDTIKPKLAIGKFVICRNQQINQRGR